ncbi:MULTISPECIES: AraC family transcriptional regulator [Streptococcus]
MFIFYPQLLYLFIIPYFRSFPKRKKVRKLSNLNELPNILIQELE